MICEHCGQEMMMQVQILISCPSDLFLKITKSDLKKKSVQILGANWNSSKFICRCGKCCYKSTT